MALPRLSPTRTLTPAQVFLGSVVRRGPGFASREGARTFPPPSATVVQEALADSFPGSTGPGDSTFKSGAVAALSVIPPAPYQVIGQARCESK